MLSQSELKTATACWCVAMRAAAPELNELDGRLGDADLGATLDKCAVLIEQELVNLPDDLEGTFKKLAQASAKASGSSFGTLLTVACMTAAKHSANKASLSRSDIVELLSAVIETLSARGGANLGDKTVLDGLQAIVVSLQTAADEDRLLAAARDAVQRALDEFRDRPNRIGRARMFAERTIGMDDPGMVALLRMVEGLTAKSRALG